MTPAGDFSTNKKTRSSDIFVTALTFPTLPASANTLKSNLEYGIEMSAYVMIGRPGRWRSFSPSKIKGFRCEIIISKIHFSLIFFCSAVKLNVTKGYILDLAGFKTLVTISPLKVKEGLKMCFLCQFHLSPHTCSNLIIIPN